MKDVRLLPWTGQGGKPCYLDTDGTGYLSRVADTVERVQLGMAGDLLDHADEMLADRRTTPAQLRFLLARMSEALTDTRRIAESRGARLPVPACEESDDNDGLTGPLSQA
ncbi:hypothetical protein ACM01_27120 [Streptomyces viridochromogenes]|uniref:Uncharacterized protein n=1 Tax=Streptomyces viridochromogenes TaxID=1938 RepID=A0A0J8C132_STRVR|nr:hypothetical protein [Streptomyces viridochromogenes]KMS71430.1 hypothetical protein ACM01_27120 [Streptomyces viridochromogenes]